MSRFDKARVLSVADAGAGLLHVQLEPPSSFVVAYARVGQYVQVAVGDSRSYFALCGDPGRTPWSLLLRPRGTVAEALSAAAAGSEFSVSEPLGSGFDWAKTQGAEVFVVVAGTGFAIAPPILRARVQDGMAAETSLLFGTDGHVPLRTTLQALAVAQVSITLCVPVSTNDAAAAGKPDFPVVDANLENALATRLLALRPLSERPTEHQRRRVCVFAAGPEALLAALQTLLARENELAGTPWCELLLNA